MNWTTLVAVLLIPSVVLGQTVPLPAPSPQVVTYPPGDDKIVVLKKGDPSPFTGQLFDDNTALRWVVWLQQYKGRYAIDLKAEEDTCKVEQDHSAALTKITADRDSAVQTDLVQRLKDSETARLKAEDELRNPSFFDRNGVWFGVGVIATIITSVSTAYLVHASTK